MIQSWAEMAMIFWMVDDILNGNDGAVINGETGYDTIMGGDGDDILDDTVLIMYMATLAMMSSLAEVGMIMFTMMMVHN